MVSGPDAVAVEATACNAGAPAAGKAAESRLWRERIIGRKWREQTGGSARDARARRWLRRGRMSAAVFALIVVALWQASSAFLSPILLSTPSKIADALGQLVTSRVLWNAVGGDARNLILGMILSAALGIAMGFWIGLGGPFGRALEPILALANATPMVALLPIIEVWLGYSTTTRVGFIVVVAAWAIAVNTAVGVRNVSRNYRDLCKVFGFGRWSSLRKVMWPATVPYIFTGVRVALALGIVGMIIGGQAIGEGGLGGLAETYGTDFQPAQLFAIIIVTTLMAMLLFGALNLCARLRYRWMQDLARQS